MKNKQLTHIVNVKYKDEMNTTLYQISKTTINTISRQL